MAVFVFKVIVGFWTLQTSGNVLQAASNRVVLRAVSVGLGRLLIGVRLLVQAVVVGYLAQPFTIFGQHIHAGCATGDDALCLLHAPSRYIPHFIALAASSPFVQCRDTLVNSARLNSVFAFPPSGREFESGYFARMEHTGTVKSMKDCYWDIRPEPALATIELRVCDKPLTVERAASGWTAPWCIRRLSRPCRSA